MLYTISLSLSLSLYLSIYLSEARRVDLESKTRNVYYPQSAQLFLLKSDKRLTMTEGSTKLSGVNENWFHTVAGVLGNVLEVGKMSYHILLVCSSLVASPNLLCDDHGHMFSVVVVTSVPLRTIRSS